MREKGRVPWWWWWWPLFLRRAMTAHLASGSRPVSCFLWRLSEARPVWVVNSQVPRTTYHISYINCSMSAWRIKRGKACGPALPSRFSPGCLLLVQIRRYVSRWYVDTARAVADRSHLGGLGGQACQVSRNEIDRFRRFPFLF